MKEQTADEAAVGSGLRVGPSSDPDRYRLAELRSRGGEGELWRAAIDVDGVPLSVAVKVIHPNRVDEIDEWSARWRRQAELLRSLDHPGLVKVREVFEGPVPHPPGSADPSSRSLFLVMNWADGETLEEWVSRRPDRDLLESVRIVARVASALDYLHSGVATGKPVLHRDVKPSNVIIEGQSARLVDFGFARLMTGDSMTLAGTPSYLAPEVVSGGEYTEASDRFSLGATAYFAITGERPSLGDRAEMRSRLTAAAGLEGREDLADHVLAMLNPSPFARPASCVEWAQGLAAGAVSDSFAVPAARAPVPQPALEGSDRERPPRRSRRGLLLLAGVIVLLLIGGGVAMLASRHSGSAAATDETNGSSPSGPAKIAVGSRPIMPSVTGLTLESARSTLQAKGITNIFVEPRDSGDPPGTVISQNPPPGTSVRGAVTIVVAQAPAALPDVTGQTLSDAENTLQALGVQVTTKDVLDDSKVDGTVIAQDPPAGSPFQQAVTLSVARQPVSTFLADLSVVEGDDSSTDVINVNGTSYTHAIWYQQNGPEDCCDPNQTTAGYDLGRHYREFKATIGVSDDSNSNFKVKFEVLADGRTIYSKTLSLGQTAKVDVDMTDALRLTIVATALSGQGKAVWGDAAILGLGSEIPSPSPSSGD